MTLLAKLWPRRAAQSALMDVLGDTWLVAPGHLESTLQILQRGAAAFTSASEIREAMAFGEEMDGERVKQPYALGADGTATIRLSGMLLKEVPCLFDFMGVDATSTAKTKASIEKALADPYVKAIRLEVDSPGGTVSGLASLADAVYAARGKKPITAHADDLACSAAYWVACQAERFTAGPTATIGSIGVYTVIEDLSAAAAAEGVKVHLITSGPLKGAGEPGTVVTEQHIAHAQERINTMADLFVAAVARGMGMPPEQARSLATGACWIGEGALQAGLIHAVEGADARPPNPDAPAAPAEEEEEEDMPTENPSPASAAELDKLRAELAAERARADKAEAEKTGLQEAFEKIKKDRLTAIFEEYTGLAFEAPDRAKTEERLGKVFGEDPSGLKAHLQELAEVRNLNRPTAVGGAPKHPKEKGASNEQTAHLQKILKISDERLKQAEGLEHLGHDGKAVINGDVVQLRKKED